MLKDYLMPNGRTYQFEEGQHPACAIEICRAKGVLNRDVEEPQPKAKTKKRETKNK